jgi:hypothetical protein
MIRPRPSNPVPNKSHQEHRMVYDFYGLVEIKGY